MARSWMRQRMARKNMGAMLSARASAIQRKSQSLRMTVIISLKSMSRNITTNSPTLTTRGMANLRILPRMPFLLLAACVWEPEGCLIVIADGLIWRKVNKTWMKRRKKKIFVVKIEIIPEKCLYLE